jgi:hypothetical protein
MLTGALTYFMNNISIRRRITEVQVFGKSVDQFPDNMKAEHGALRPLQ